MSSFTVHRMFPAFTLLELLVGMIISGMVLAVTFSAFHIVSKQTAGYRLKTQSMEEVSFFVSRLNADFSDAKNAAFVSGKAIRLEFPQRSLEYRFRGKYVLHIEKDHTDTFYVAVDAAGVFNDGIKVEEESAIDELRLELTIEGKREMLFFKKEKDAKTVIDAEELKDAY